MSGDDQFICNQRDLGKSSCCTETVLSWQEAINNKLITPRKICFSKTTRQPFIRASFFIESWSGNEEFWFPLLSLLTLGFGTIDRSPNLSRPPQLHLEFVLLYMLSHVCLQFSFACYMLLCLFYRFNSKRLLSTKLCALYCSRCWR